MLGLKHKFGSVYHPQSQGCVERMNRMLKEKMAKAMYQTKLNWVQALPLALMSTRMSMRDGHGATPCELHMGRMFAGPEHSLKNVGGVRTDPGVKGMCLTFAKFSPPTSQDAVKDSPAQKGDLTSPGAAELPSHVLLKVLKRKWTESRWTGPFKVAERTSHTVRLQGKGSTWFHISHTRPIEDIKRGTTEAE